MAELAEAWELQQSYLESGVGTAGTPAGTGGGRVGLSPTPFSSNCLFQLNPKP